MSEYTWVGRAGKGAMRALRARKRAEAEQRNANTPPSRTRLARRIAADKEFGSNG